MLPIKKRKSRKSESHNAFIMGLPHTIESKDQSIPAVLKRFSSRTQLTLNLQYRTRDRCLADFRAKGVEEIAALAKDLHAFLTSWGFSERTALLLPSDAHLLVPIVEIILDPLFTPLRDSVARDLLDPQVQRLVMLAATKIAKAYRECLSVEIENPDELVTHIIAATFGSIPPFENSLRKGIRILGLAPDSFSVSSLRTLAGFYLAHETEFEEFRSEQARKNNPHTQMAVLGFYFWELGNENLGNKTSSR